MSTSKRLGDAEALASPPPSGKLLRGGLRVPRPGLSRASRSSVPSSRPRARRRARLFGGRRGRVAGARLRGLDRRWPLGVQPRGARGGDAPALADRRRRALHLHDHRLRRRPAHRRDARLARRLAGLPADAAPTVQLAAGSTLGGHLDTPSGVYAFSPGPTGAAGVSYRLLPGTRPFVILTANLSFSAASTQLSGGTGANVSYDAFDLRGGALVGTTFAGVLSPYAVVRAFGGPITWQYQGQSVTGTDAHHYQVGAGLDAGPRPRGRSLRRGGAARRALARRRWGGRVLKRQRRPLTASRARPAAARGGAPAA